MCACMLYERDLRIGKLFTAPANRAPDPGGAPRSTAGLGDRRRPTATRRRERPETDDTPRRERGQVGESTPVRPYSPLQRTWTSPQTPTIIDWRRWRRRCLHVRELLVHARCRCVSARSAGRATGTGRRARWGNGAERSLGHRAGPLVEDDLECNRGEEAAEGYSAKGGGAHGLDIVVRRPGARWSARTSERESRWATCRRLLRGGRRWRHAAHCPR